MGESKRRKVAPIQVAVEAPRCSELNWNVVSYNDKQSFASYVAQGEWALNDSLVAGLTQSRFVHPTDLQRATIPLILAGGDCLINAPTGTGKTFAYGLPILSQIADAEAMTTQRYNEWREAVKALIVVPSKELVAQVTEVLQGVCSKCSDLVTFYPFLECPSRLKEVKVPPKHPNVWITQPAALLKLCRLLFQSMGKRYKGLAFFPNLRHMVVDEADLVMSTYGFHKETSELFRPTPESWGGASVTIVPIGVSLDRRVQVVLASATLNEEVATLKSMALHKPSVVCLSEDTEPERHFLLSDGPLRSLIHVKVPKAAEFARAQIEHKHILIDRKKDEDYLALFCLLQLNWCPKKTLVFTNSTEQAYKVYIFLKHFGLSCGVVAPTQTLEKRLSTLTEFNQSACDILIGCDSAFDGVEADETTEVRLPQTKKGRKRKVADSSSSVSRGLDFKGVSSVILFEPAQDSDQYTHRVGRAARGFKRAQITGLAVSLTTESELGNLQSVLDENSSECIDCTALAAFRAYKYRVSDVVRGLTSKAVKEVQVKEMADTLIGSKDNLSAPEECVLRLLNGSKKKFRGPEAKKTLRVIPKYLEERSRHVIK